MNILFVTDDNRHGSSIMRALWPSLWINKFTGHNSWCLEATQSGSSQHDALIEKADVVVCHKANPSQRRIAALALSNGKTVIYDTDDFDIEVFGAFYPLYWMKQSFDGDKWMRENASGITVASKPLQEKIGGYVIENGFDTTLRQFRPHSQPYFESSQGEHFKIAWGGSSTHMRDFEMFYKLGVLESVMQDWPLDVYVYGLTRDAANKTIGRGVVRHLPLHPLGIEWYIHDYFCDATFLFAPLLQEKFNDHRSTLKLVEAGVAGKTIVASRVASYETYEGRDGVVLVDNDAASWRNAFNGLLENKIQRDVLAERNTHISLTEYNAETLTHKRIQYFERVLNG